MIILVCPRWLRDLIEDWLGFVADMIGLAIDGPYYGDRYATITPEQLDETEAA